MSWIITPQQKYPVLSFLLDTYPAAAAYSLRQLRSGVTNVVRVRRSSDNAELDFTATQVTDGTLTSWLGANTGFVRTWYDQSGNARHTAQTTTGNQPVVVTSGLGGQPSINYVSSDSLVMPILPSGSYSWFFALGPQSGATISVFGNGQSYAPIATGTNSTNILRIDNVDDPSGAQQLYNGEATQSVVTRADCRNLLIAGNNLVLFEGIPASSSAFNIGFATSGYALSGLMGDAIIYSGTPSSVDRAAIESNINGHYAIY